MARWQEERRGETEAEKDDDDEDTKATGRHKKHTGSARSLGSLVGG